MKLLIKVAEVLDAIYPAAFKKIKDITDKKFKEAEKTIDQFFADTRAAAADKTDRTVTFENKRRLKIRILKS